MALWVSLSRFTFSFCRAQFSSLGGMNAKRNVRYTKAPLSRILHRIDGRHRVGLLIFRCREDTGEPVDGSLRHCDLYFRLLVDVPLGERTQALARLSVCLRVHPQ